VEDFILYQHKASVQSFQQMRTSELIGWITTLPRGNTKVVMQTASQAKTWTDNRLLKLGFLYKSGNAFYSFSGQQVDKHARDAFRHQIYYMNSKIFNGCITLQLYKNYFILGLVEKEHNVHVKG
jgi:hypothetical protein